jgi:hypothetical protein
MAFPDPVTPIFLSAAPGDRHFNVGCVAKTDLGLNSMPATQNRARTVKTPRFHKQAQNDYPNGQYNRDFNKRETAAEPTVR